MHVDACLRMSVCACMYSEASPYVSEIHACALVSKYRAPQVLFWHNQVANTVLQAATNPGETDD